MYIVPYYVPPISSLSFLLALRCCCTWSCRLGLVSCIGTFVIIHVVLLLYSARSVPILFVAIVGIIFLHLYIIHTHTHIAILKL